MAQTITLEAIERMLRKNKSHRSQGKNKPGYQDKRRRPGVGQGTGLPSGWPDILKGQEKGRKGVELKKPGSISPGPQTEPPVGWGRKRPPALGKQPTPPKGSGRPHIGARPGGGSTGVPSGKGPVRKPLAPNIDKRFPRAPDDGPKYRENKKKGLKGIEKKVLGGNLRPLGWFGAPTHGGRQQPKPPRGNIEQSSVTSRGPSKGVNTRAALERRLKNKNYTQTGDDAGWHRDRRVKKSQGRPIEETPKQKQAQKGWSQEAVKRRRNQEAAESPEFQAAKKQWEEMRKREGTLIGRKRATQAKPLTATEKKKNARARGEVPKKKSLRGKRVSA